jgi:hypothetical protein
MMRTHLTITATILLWFFPHGVVALATITKGPWMTRASQLLEFKKQHGHVRVPKRYKEDPGLGLWVNKQRQQYRNFVTGQKPCSLTRERIEILDRLGFSWNALDDPVDNDESNWWAYYRELQEQMQLKSEKLSSSSCASLAQAIPRNSHLGKWMQKQRVTELSVQKVKALDQLDPDWRMSFRELVWEQRYRELQVYRNEHGDCCVPITYTENQPLAHWVSNQRKLYNKNLLPSKRLKRLNAIGFVWNRWEHEFAKKTEVWSEYSES